ncbi:hypothetical protein LQW54_000114 [Pestalotiopsis sp. IQ-011]
MPRSGVPKYIPSDALGPQRCSVCDKLDGLLRCGGCKVISYCGAEHQISHRGEHKDACNKIKKTLAKLEREEAGLRNHPPDMFLPANVFETCVGQFWGILDTRDYMRARFAAANALLQVESHVAVGKTLEHFTDMLRLCRSDNLGVRDVVPFLLLRLGREQECYDFLKWYATTGSRSDYDWGDNTLPFLDTRGANVLEGLDVFSKDTSLSQLVALTLLNLRLQLDLSVCQDEEYDSDEYDGFSRPIGSVASKIARRGDSVDIHMKAEALESQYHTLLRWVQDANPYFWSALVDDVEPVPPPYYSPGSGGEAMLVLCQCRSAWVETEDAILMVDADISNSTSVYQGRAESTTSEDPTQPQPVVNAAEVLERRRGTGKVFPSRFDSSAPPSNPAAIFTASNATSQTGSRFVHRNNHRMALAYVDGACSNYGMQGSRAAWAVVYGPVEGCIVSKRLGNRGPFGDEYEATSNRAELRAAIAALRLTNWRDEGFDSLVIATDSTYVVDGATGWTKGWVRNGWKTRTGDGVKNKDLWELLLGEVERWNAQRLKVEFLRIPRELNSAADTAAKAAVHQGAIEHEFKDSVIQISSASSGSPGTKPRILALCLNTGNMLEEAYPSHHSVLKSKGSFEKATTQADALRLLNQEPAPSVILIFDGAVASLTKVWERIIDRLRGGATVIMAGGFSSFVNVGQFNRLFMKVGLPWKQGSYHRSTVSLRRQAVPSHLVGQLPATDNQKALFVQGVERSAIWYAESEASTEGAVAVAKVGKGRLAYLGDVNGEEASVAVISALCEPAAS